MSTDQALLEIFRDFARNNLKTSKKFSMIATNIFQRLGLITPSEAIAYDKVDHINRIWRKAVKLERTPEHPILASTEGYCIAFTEEEKKDAFRKKSSNT